MRSIQKPKNKKKLIIALIIVAALLAAAGAYIWIARPFQTNQVASDTEQRPVNTVDYSPATEDEKKDSEAAKDRIVDQENNPPQPTGNVVVTIIRANQMSAGQPLSIRTSVDGASTGTCSATLKNGSQTVTGNGTIAFNATSYSCNIDIAASSFPTGGQWTLEVTATNGSATSPKATQEVSITK